MNIHNGRFIRLATRCGLGSWTRATSHWRYWESGSCLVFEADCLHSPTLVLKRLLESCWSSVYVGITNKEVGSNISEGTLQQKQKWIGRWACQREWGQTRKAKYTPFFYQGCHQKVLPDPQWGKPSQECSGACVLLNVRYGQVDNQDFSHHRHLSELQVVMFIPRSEFISTCAFTG